jgi:hypothetical protein
MLRQRLGVSFHRLHIVSRITFLYFLVLTDGPRLDRVFVSRLFLLRFIPQRSLLCARILVVVLLRL